MAEKPLPICSFCGSDANDGLLIKGADGSHICDGCIKECNELMDSRKAKTERAKGRPSLSPKAIKEHLDKYVIGQEIAKKQISIAIYSHFKRINGYETNGVEIQKSNILMLGPTGSGKSYLAKNLAKLLKVPVAIADATSLTQAGYVGDDVESVLSRLVLAAGGDIELAQKGICYIDEIDKIARSESSGGKDIAGEGVQQSMLKILEGSMVSINPEGPKKGPGTPSQWIDTTNILFICGGAFVGIGEQMASRQLGLATLAPKKASKKIRSNDLIKYGMIPEFVGRLPVIAQLEMLSIEDLVKILKNTKDCLVDQYKALFLMDGIEVDFSDKFLELVANRASTEGTGARGLRSIMESSMEGIMFEGPDLESKTLLIDESMFVGE